MIWTSGPRRTSGSGSGYFVKFPWEHQAVTSQILLWWMMWNVQFCPLSQWCWVKNTKNSWLRIWINSKSYPKAELSVKFKCRSIDWFFKQSNRQTDEPGQLCNLLDVWNSRNRKQLTITFCLYLQNQNVCLFVLIFACSSGRSPRRNRSLLHLTFLLCFPIRSRNVKDVCFLHELISASWQMFFYFCQTTPGLYSVMVWSPVQVYPTFWPVTAGMGSTPLWPWISKWMEWWIWWVFLLFCLSPV